MELIKTEQDRELYNNTYKVKNAESWPVGMLLVSLYHSPVSSCLHSPGVPFVLTCYLIIPALHQTDYLVPTGNIVLINIATGCVLGVATVHCTLQCLGNILHNYQHHLHQRRQHVASEHINCTPSLQCFTRIINFPSSEEGHATVHLEQSPANCICVALWLIY